MVVTVANRLRSTSTVVANNVNVLLFVRLENVHVYEPKLLPGVALTSTVRMTVTDNPAFVAESGDIIPDTPTLGDQQTNTIVDQTAHETNTQADLPCQLDLGRKYEYCITDIHEIWRRHTLLPASTYTSKPISVGSGATVYTVFQIPVFPPWDGKDMFAAWSGHLKYRIFTRTADPCVVMYDAHPGNGAGGVNLNSAVFTADLGKAVSTWSGITYVQRKAGMIMPGAVEMTFPVGTNSSMIDISVPFNSHYNFLPTDGNAATGLSNFSSSNGSLFVRVPVNTVIEVFVAAGDDFRFEVFYPRGNGSTQIGELTGAAVTPVGVANTEVAGYMF